VGASSNQEIEARFRTDQLHGAATIPYDEQLAGSLRTGTYTVRALHGDTRVAVKRLGLAVAEQLV
jgi:hypothetical protein